MPQGLNSASVFLKTESTKDSLKGFDIDLLIAISDQALAVRDLSEAVYPSKSDKQTQNIEDLFLVLNKEAQLFRPAQGTSEASLSSSNKETQLLAAAQNTSAER